jgi:hypothetical protein
MASGSRLPTWWLALALVATGSTRAARAGEPETVPAGRRQLFVDDHLIDSASGVRRVIHPAVKHPDNPVLLPVRPWEGQYTLLYGTVLRDDEEGLWKMWYSTMNHFRYARDVYPESTYLCYATSKDGLRWEKPELGLVSYRGSTENNIVMEGHRVPESGIEGILDCVSVLKDPRDPDPSRRYKMMIWHENRRREGGRWVRHTGTPRPTGHYVAFSPDGLRWVERPEPAFTYDPVRDTMTTMWDPKAGKFVAFVKQHVAGKRARFRSESDDFLRWSTPAPMLAADAQDPPDLELYNNTGFAYEGMYLGLLTVLHPSPPEDVYLDVQLIASRDGRLWERVGDRSPFLPVGRRDVDWDFGFNSPGSGPPVRVGDELWFYYSGRSYRHPVPGQPREPNHGAIGLARLRLDGFASLDAGEAEGTVVTRPLRPGAAGLVVNADASAGELRVEVLGADGTPLPGLARADCVPVRGDSVRHRVRWGAVPGLSGRAGGPVRLKFSLRLASLYGFAFEAD